MFIKDQLVAERVVKMHSRSLRKKNIGEQHRRNRKDKEKLRWKKEVMNGIALYKYNLERNHRRLKN